MVKILDNGLLDNHEYFLTSILYKTNGYVNKTREKSHTVGLY